MGQVTEAMSLISHIVADHLAVFQRDWFGSKKFLIHTSSQVQHVKQAAREAKSNIPLSNQNSKYNVTWEITYREEHGLQGFDHSEMSQNVHGARFEKCKTQNVKNHLEAGLNYPIPAFRFFNQFSVKQRYYEKKSDFFSHMTKWCTPKIWPAIILDNNSNWLQWFR